MTDTNPGGWPDPARPGVPANPERDGVHRLAFPKGEHDWIWRAERSNSFWVTHTGRYVEPCDVSSFRARYLGPCFTPDEVAARVAEARADGMREAAGMVRTHAAAAKKCSEEGDVIHRIRAEYLSKAFALNAAADDIAAAILAAIPEPAP